MGQQHAASLTQRELELERLGPGTIFGAISLLTLEARTATARARVDSRVLRLPEGPMLIDLQRKLQVWSF